MADVKQLKKELDEIQKELAALKEGTRAYKALQEQKAEIEASLQGDGAIAQGAGAKAVGKGGILIEGSFQGNIYVGVQPENDEQALAIYRRMVMQSTASLPLRGVDVGASDATQTQNTIGLANVYVDLDTTTPLIRVDRTGIKTELDTEALIEREQGKYPVMETAIQNRRFVLLGDPGSGKSTFVNFLAYALAANVLEPERNWLEHLKGWDKNEADILPIVVILRDFARAHAENLPAKAEISHVWNFIEERLNAQNLQAAVKPLKAALEAGKAMLLFDGLDEVPTEKQRLFVRDAVRAFINRYGGCRYLLTCRVLSYQPPADKKPDLRLNELLSFEIAEFDEEKISRFVEAWYSELARLGTIKSEEREALTARLNEAVRRPDLTDLASNPLLLTVMALVHTHKGRLPDARALLYEETIEILLWRWEQIKLGGQDSAPRLRQYLMEAGRTEVDLKRVLREIAHHIHSSTKPDEENNNKLADIDEHLLIKTLATLKCDEQNPEGDWNWARRIVDLIKLRAGLLLEKQPGVFTFPHRTFQEYLAGAHLANQNNFAQHVVELTLQKTLWREAILYAVGRLVYVSEDLDKPLALAAELCPNDASDTDLAWWQAWLAGDVLQEIGINRIADSAFGRDMLRQTQNRLANLIEYGKLTPRERNEVGKILSKLGDPRFSASHWFLPSDLMFGFIHIPAGEFIMGNDLSIDEQPQHTVDIPEYWIQKYPVTAQQFHIFLRESGYEPDDPKSKRGILNHPITYVTWHDALEYCNWLNEKLLPIANDIILGNLLSEDQKRFWLGLHNKTLKISIPNEPEWEKAARGVSGWIYPWGNVFMENFANVKTTKLESTSVVGSFPNDTSIYGVKDLIGNVKEWTRSLWGLDQFDPGYKYPYNANDGRENIKFTPAIYRIIRGGDYQSLNDEVYCSRRFKQGNLNWAQEFGFRIVATSSSFV
jgi:formylglycine-generating enzyme required for sulfatase activity